MQSHDIWNYISDHISCHWHLFASTRNLDISNEMATPPDLGSVSHYITSCDPKGKSTFLAAPNPPLVQQSDTSLRVDYIYSTIPSATGPVLTDQDDYMKHQDERAAHPYVLFPLAGGSAASVTTVS